jgi:hypothetical protein
MSSAGRSHVKSRIALLLPKWASRQRLQRLPIKLRSRLARWQAGSFELGLVSPFVSKLHCELHYQIAHSFLLYLQLHRIGHALIYRQPRHRGKSAIQGPEWCTATIRASPAGRPASQTAFRHLVIPAWELHNGIATSEGSSNVKLTCILCTSATIIIT